jgi:hydrogenase-4 membrane subunit HyfE
MFASVSAIFSTTTSGSCAISASTQSSRVSEFPFRRGLPANARTLIGIAVFLERDGKIPWFLINAIHAGIKKKKVMRFS